MLFFLKTNLDGRKLVDPARVTGGSSGAFGQGMPVKIFGAVAGKAKRRPSILVVAAQDNMRELLRDILESYGYGSIAVASLSDAAKVVSQEQIDLVAVELDRPGPRHVDGMQALRRSRTGLKVLAVLGDSSLACLESLVDGIVWKPFSVDRLAALVSGFIGPPELQS